MISHANKNMSKSVLKQQQEYWRENIIPTTLWPVLFLALIDVSTSMQNCCTNLKKKALNYDMQLDGMKRSRQRDSNFRNKKKMQNQLD